MMTLAFLGIIYLVIGAALAIYMAMFGWGVPNSLAIAIVICWPFIIVLLACVAWDEWRQARLALRAAFGKEKK